MPAGTGKRIDPESAPVYDGIFNDVRGDGLPIDAMYDGPIDAYFEHTTVYEHREGLTPVTQMSFYIGHPTGNGSDGGPAFITFATFAIEPEDGSTMHWTTRRMPASGRLHASKIHHHSFTHEAWIVAGSAADLGIGWSDVDERFRENATLARQWAYDEEDILRGPRKPQSLSPGETAASRMLRLQESLKAANGAAIDAGKVRQPPRLLARTLSVDANVTRVVGRGHPVPTLSGWDAQVHLVGDDNHEFDIWEWEAGDEFTIVAFSAPVEEKAAGHTIWQAFAELHDA
jgi:hypothetical protein